VRSGAYSGCCVTVPRWTLFQKLLLSSSKKLARLFSAEAHGCA
jgi:hypothetical protein